MGRRPLRLLRRVTQRGRLLMFVCMVFAFIGGLAGHAVALAFNEASQ